MGYLHFIILYNIRLSTFVTADFLCQLCFLSLKVVRRYLFLGIVFFKVPVPLFNCCKWCGIREILVFVIFMMMMMIKSIDIRSDFTLITRSLQDKGKGLLNA